MYFAGWAERCQLNVWPWSASREIKLAVPSFDGSFQTDFGPPEHVAFVDDAPGRTCAWIPALRSGNTGPHCPRGHSGEDKGHQRPLAIGCPLEEQAAAVLQLVAGIYSTLELVARGNDDGGHRCRWKNGVTHSGPAARFRVGRYMPRIAQVNLFKGLLLLAAAVFTNVK